MIGGRDDPFGDRAQRGGIARFAQHRADLVKGHADSGNAEGDGPAHVQRRYRLGGDFGPALQQTLCSCHCGVAIAGLSGLLSKLCKSDDHAGYSGIEAVGGRIGDELALRVGCVGREIGPVFVRGLVGDDPVGRRLGHPEIVGRRANGELPLLGAVPTVPAIPGALLAFADCAATGFAARMTPAPAAKEPACNSLRRETWGSQP
ncbi:hypothetical protein SAMN06295937_103418 [Sphingopyxis flava]|uniref:Uncharacterized protein n=1 Tax=Sphingopyxis flava TaxID=1507287 RepID=A0A1T5FFD7_9SPHN|nr:hypothetical protein SAMN06295937_103418 [Sphingopyxis flava]